MRLVPQAQAASTPSGVRLATRRAEAFLSDSVMAARKTTISTGPGNTFRHFRTHIHS